MGRLRQLLGLERLDAALAFCLLAAAGAEAATAAAPWSGRPSTWPAALGFAPFLTLPVAWRRTFPLPALLCVLTASVAQGLLASPPESLAVLAAWVILLYSVARHAVLSHAAAGLAAALAGAALLTAVSRPGGGVADYLAALLVPVVPPWLAGALRAHQMLAREFERLSRELAEERDERARAAVTAERAEIARELHDVVTHNVSIIVLHAVGALGVIDRGADAVRPPLENIERVARQALAEMRRMLGILRPAEEARLDPQPGLADVRSLVGEARIAGASVELVVEDDGALDVPAGVDLAAFRVVQEALTNVVKHSQPPRAEVLVRRSTAGLEIEVRDSGSSRAPGARDGHGLTGMRERVALYGGELQAGPAGGESGFRVVARFPAEGWRT